MPVIKRAFGQLKDGRDVNSLVLIDSRNEFSVEILEYGATIRAITLPARDGRFVNAVLCYDTLAEYEDGNAYLGATIGRCAGRTAADAHATLRLTRNEAANHLHGGEIGFSHSLWQTAEVQDGDTPSVRLRHRSPAGEDGYPGELLVDAEFSVVDALSLRVVIHARSDADTPLNLTLHPYFNLSGNPTGPVDDHRLRIDASRILALDSAKLPTGDLIAVRGTPFDFREARPIGASRYDGHAQLHIADGYDHYYVLNESGLTESALDESGRNGRGAVAAELYSPATALGVRVSTNQRGIQFYSGNQLDKARPVPFPARGALCLEPHAFPNAINEPRFPDIMLRSGETYRYEACYQFYRDA
ncbi:MAG TPA: aldose epimerase family protein [Rhodanobacteraceae bacterium]|nr:aldose epimerase family protein [Rhodanobacteraceae bacterium]